MCREYVVEFTRQKSKELRLVTCRDSIIESSAFLPVVQCTLMNLACLISA